MIIQDALAEAAAQAAPSSPVGGGLLPIILIFFIFYFLLIRPQQKKAKQHSQMITGLKRGDVVVTSGGVVGKIARVTDDDLLHLEIANDVRVQVLKGTISQKMSDKYENISANSANDDKKTTQKKKSGK